ncbi:hypothetical protein BJX62DRAFT_13229 [Aspergillus germanicus]
MRFSRSCCRALLALICYTPRLPSSQFVTCISYTYEAWMELLGMNKMVRPSEFGSCVNIFHPHCYTRLLNNKGSWVYDFLTPQAFLSIYIITT